ncbi:MAG TPA: acyl-CoA dehydrogenase N-terminal domain-containing protein, partial [Kofleriaceae bacterium]|nr:acyl-CoA dehydrogenase N-terminal domain-containing protein [Kofleriaceae bacterium]
MPHPNQYKSNLRDLSFLLFEQFKLDELLGKAPYANWGKEEALTVLEEAYGWVQKYLGPYNRSGDQEGCRLVDGQVRVPAGFKEAWDSLFESGWRSIHTEESRGGQGGPFTL